ncbi:MAG: hypothetical protein QXE05_08390 [Nitrososphaeria archaeon]
MSAVIPPNGQVKVTKILIKSFFPALLYGLYGLIASGTFGALFYMINTSSSSPIIPSFFANFGTMAFLGFAIGFAGYLAVKFEEEL